VLSKPHLQGLLYHHIVGTVMCSMKRLPLANGGHAIRTCGQRLSGQLGGGGQCGLDKGRGGGRGGSSMEAQQEAFLLQLRLGKELRRPVSVCASHLLFHDSQLFESTFGLSDASFSVQLAIGRSDLFSSVCACVPNPPHTSQNIRMHCPTEMVTRLTGQASCITHGAV
jgi:hypothetical protein